MPDKLDCIELCSLLNMVPPAEHWPDITGVSTVDTAAGHRSPGGASCAARRRVIPYASLRLALLMRREMIRASKRDKSLPSIFLEYRT